MFQSLLTLLHRANQIAAEAFSSAVGDTTLTARQIQVLAAIDSIDGPSQAAIVSLTGIDRSTLADIASRLQKNKLIERRRSRADSRAYVLKLSPSGHAALAKARPALVTVEKALTSRLSARERSEIVDLLAKIVDGPESRRPGPRAAS